MTIYIDQDFRCHTSLGEGLTAVETDFFDGKCRQYIEGYRFVPSGESWVREDGEVFTGEMIAPAEDSRILEAAQAAYEEAIAQEAKKSADMKAALDVLGVSP